jgi:hypothetical protein
MKKIYMLLIGLILAAGIINAQPPARTKSAAISGTSLSGIINGVLTEDTHYTLDGDVVSTDSLIVMPGVRVEATGNYHIEIAGKLKCNGTDEKPITFTASNLMEAYDSLGRSGWWGGFLVDSTSLYVKVTYTHIDYTGGFDATGSTQASFDVEGSQSYNGGAKIIFENNWMFGGIDDALHLVGFITCSIKGNVLQRLGGPDGDLINIKKGAEGDICYNYIWSSANSGIKLNTGKTVLSPGTKWNIYNNTIINGNWRKVGELSSAILVDQFAAANIHNNVIVGCRNGINIASGADVNHTTYGNNLIYMYYDQNAPEADSMTNNPYIPGSWGTPQSSDLISYGHTACGSVFNHWDPDISVDTADFNVPTLATHSPAIGKGNTNPTLFTSFAGGARIGTGMAPNVDLGAYPSDNSGNKHLPTPYPGYTATVTGLGKMSANTKPSVYPNPATDNLFIISHSSSADRLQINILDMTGKEVLSETIDGDASQKMVNVSGLSNGLYLYRLTQGSSSSTGKFIKK